MTQYAAVLGLFGVMSVALAAIGILGVMAHTVGQRANEIALRLALGAQPLNVLGLVLRRRGADRQGSPSGSSRRSW